MKYLFILYYYINIREFFRLNKLNPTDKESEQKMNQDYSRFDFSLLPSYNNQKSRDKIVQNYDFILKVDDDGLSLQHISSKL